MTKQNYPILFFDGGSRGNPGKAAGGAVIVFASGEKHIVSEFLAYGTNNEAEYTGLIIGLKKALEMNLTELIVKGDSNLVVNQVIGKWKINSDRLRLLCEEAKILLPKFSYIEVSWIPRAENSLADKVVNQCLDSHA